MATLTLDDVTKRYRSGGTDEIVAVDDLSIDLANGELLVLVGPSGCGKSTTLHCIAGLEEITEGEIRIDGAVVNDQTPEERNIALVFQNYALYPHMTAKENMSFGLRMATDLRSDEIEQRVTQAAEMLDIADLLGDKPSELSGGQQQRVALGRAIVREPSVFLLDEPLSNLDAKLRTQMRTEIQRLQSDLGVTTVYVTHDQTEAMTMGDRIAVLNDGRLQQIGTPMACYYEPANRFVADFIGEPSMNFFECDRSGDSLVAPEFEYPLPDDLAAVLDGQDRITLGIRPEDVELTTEPGPHVITANVEVVEPMGDENVVHTSLDRTEIVTITSSETQVPEGRSVRLEIPPDRVHLFDGATGQALSNADRPDSEGTPYALEEETA